MAKKIDPAQMRAAVLAVRDWIERDDAPAPPRAAIAAAVRTTARTLAQDAPGGSVEVRVPPFVAVQCVDGPRHTRGTPPNVVECAPRTWLRLATGLIDFDDAAAAAEVQASGLRAGEIARLLPLLRF
jgi:hypothetical protein